MKTLLRIRVLMAVLAGALSAVSAFAATYYVKPSGNDLADGLSDANAWATIAKVNATALSAGAQVLFQSGGVYRDATLVPSGSGTSTSRIVYGAYGTGAKPILTTAIVLPSSGWTTVGGGVYSRPLATATRMVTVNNTYMVRAASLAAIVNGQYFWDSTTATLYVSDSAGSPNTTGKIYEAAQRDDVVLSTAGRDYITFQGLRFEKSSRGLVVVESASTYHTFDGCEFFAASSSTTRSGAGIHANNAAGLRVLNSSLSYLEGDGMFIRDSTGVEVTANTVDHLFDLGGDDGPDGIQLDGISGTVNNFIVQNNVVHRETNTTNKGCIIVQGGTGGLVSGNRTYLGKFGIAIYTSNTVVENNYIEGAGFNDSLRMWENDGQTNVTLRYNIVNGGANCALSIGNGTQTSTPMANINVYNNLFYNSYWGVAIGVPISGSFKNNIVWSDAHSTPQTRLSVGAIIAGGTFDSDNNIIQDKGTNPMVHRGGVSYYDMPTYQAGTSQDAHSLTAAPAWVSPGTGNFDPLAGSSTIDAGAALGSTLDFDGNPVPMGVATDIGPIEYGGLLAYEGFDYPVGALSSANGGIGWANSWTIGGGVGVTEILSGSHAWTGLPTTGNRFRIYDTDGVHQSVVRTLTKTFGANAETYWLSFLVRKYASGREAYLEMNGFNFEATSGNWQVKTPSTSYADIPGSNYASLHLIVARVDATLSGDTVYVWVDPVIASGEPSIASAAVTRSDPGFTFNTVQLRHGPFGNSTQSSEWDELRFGSSFHAVVSGGNLDVDNADTAHTASTGAWTSSTSTPGYLGTDYVHDGNTAKGTKTFSFLPPVTAAGNYLVYARWPADTNRATNVPIDIIKADGTTSTVTVNQQLNSNTWVLLGVFPLSPANAEVRIRTTGTTGYVMADGVRVVAQ